MNNFLTKYSLIIVFDFLFVLFAFWTSRYISDLPRWYWLMLSSVIWVFIGLVSGKLYYNKFKKKRYAVISLTLINLLSTFVLYSFYELVVGYECNSSFFVVIVLIYVLELFLYYILNLFVYQKMPYYYEAPEISENIEPIKNVTNQNEIDNAEVNAFLSALNEENIDPIESVKIKPSENTIISTALHFKDLTQYEKKNPAFIIHNVYLNNVIHINSLLAASNDLLMDNGYVACFCVTASIRKELIMGQFPNPLNKVVYFLDYLYNRVFPKMPIVKYPYKWITGGNKRVLTRVEVLGRLYRAGFDVQCEKIVSGKLYIVAKKIQAPIRDDKPSNGMLIRLKRNGLNGKKIGVYKFRTMHAYSEYLQPYMYKTEGLAKDGGRYGNDYRVSGIGKVTRKIFIDELPMLINWAKGDLKLVGVRPLSNHYLSLYTEEFRVLRLKVKPGLFPPFYADRPQSIEEKMESERRYIEAYLKQPIRTDWIYFWRIFRSIVFGGTRSE